MHGLFPFFFGKFTPYTVIFANFCHGKAYNLDQVENYKQLVQDSKFKQKNLTLFDKSCFAL